MHFLPILSLTGAAYAAALARRDVTYSQSTRDSTYARSFGVSSQDSFVNTGVTVWLSGGGTHNFYGNLNNNGTIVVSQTDYLKQNPYAGGQTANFVGSTSQNGNLVNNGFISLNDFGSASAPTYDWYLHTMQNRGSLQFCGRGDTGGSTYQLYCDLDCYNYGVIDFEQYTRNLGASFVWRNDVIGLNAANNVYNEGAFRLVNTVYHNVQNVRGSGCWVIDEGSVLYLEDGTGAFQNAGYGPSFPNQKIYFVADAAQPAGRLQTIHMDTQVYSRNSNFGPQVYGFGSGKAIEFYESIKTFAYSNGVLNVAFASGNQVNIKLGAGYDASQFYQARNPQHYNSAGYNAIFYRGSVPAQQLPGVCQVNLAKCADPASTVTLNPSSSTTTTTTTGATSSTTTVATTTAVTTSPAATSSTASATSTRVSTSVSTSASASTATTSTVATSSTGLTTSSSATTTSRTTSQLTTTTAVTTATTSPVTTSTASTTTSIVTGNGPCANGAQPDRTYTASNGDVYGVCLNTDFNGGDLTNVGDVLDANSCAETCSKTPNCVAGSLLKGANVCYLKSTRNAGQANNNVDSVYKISGTSSSSTLSATTTSSLRTTSSVSSSAITTTAMTTTSRQTSSSTISSATQTTTGSGPCANGAGPDRTYTTANGDAYGVCLNTDFPGGNLGTPSVSASSPEQCADICSRTSGCVAGNLVRGGPCYLKSALTPAVANNGVDGIYKISNGTPVTTSASTSSSVMSTSATTSPVTSSATTSSIATTVTTTSSAPATTTSMGTGPCAYGGGPDSTITLSNGDVYGVCLNTDFNGGDISNSNGISSPQELAQACSNTPGCVAGSVVRSAGVGYLKNARNPGNPNSNVDSVYKISSGTGSSTTTTVGATTSVKPTTTTASTTQSGICPTQATVTVTVTATPTS